MQDVADDGHAQFGEVALVMADGVHVEQALRRVRMAPVAGVDDMNVGRDMFGDQVRRAAGGMAHNEHVGLHRRQIGHGVEYRFAFALRGHIDRQVDNVGRQPLGGDLECRACPGRSFEKQVEHRLAAQQRHFLDLALGDADEGFRGIKDLPQDVRRQALQRQQVMQFAVFVELRICRIKPHVQSRVSCRANRPCASRVSSILSPGATLTSAPEKSAETGNSRPPRSTSVARRMRAGRP